MHLMSRRVLPLVLAALLAAGCGGPIKKEASYPTRPTGSDKILYSDQKRETIWGEGETLSSKLFGKDDDKAEGGSGIGVNSFLWRAALDTVSFMPVSSADPFGGVILTDWYENPDESTDKNAAKSGIEGERFKVNVYILDRQLRADGLRVAVFKQEKKKGAWKDAKVDGTTATNIENAILTRARELRVAQMGTK